jgi:hypothetical protein
MTNSPHRESLNSTGQERIIPDAIYFDTNILRQLESHSSNVVFLELRDMANKIKAQLCVPEIVVKERFNQRNEEVFALINKIESTFNNIEYILK